MRLIDPNVRALTFDDNLSGPALGRATQRARERRRAAAATPWIILVFVAGAAAFAVWDLTGRAKTSKAAAARTGDELQITRERAAVAERDLIAAQGALATEKQLRTEEVGKLRAELDATAVSAKVAQERAEKADALADGLEKSVAKTEGELTRSRGKLTLSLVDKVMFPSGKAELTPQGKVVLEKVGALFNKFPDKQIWVIGHTDDIPIRNEWFESNWELSAARALTVVHFLQDEAKVDPKRLAAAGMGPYRPVSRSKRAKNRRIEIVLLPKDVEVIKE